MRIACLLVFVAAAAASPQPSRTEIDRALTAVYPSLVRISVVAADYRGGREVRSESSGSGTIISADGYVVTNHHVAGHARRIVCTLSTQEQIPADLVGTDALSDISVLKLRPERARTFPAAVFASGATVTRGEAVLALGSPLALSQSVTAGIVSNPEMVMPATMAVGPSLDGEDVGSIVRWIGHDAAIYPGNSGGPLVNLKGEVVGVNELSFGLSAAIPTSVVKPVVQAIVAQGFVKRASIGIELQPRLSHEPRKGALIAWVEEGSPAALAGIESGDLLVSLNGRPIDVQFTEQLPLVNQLVASLPSGRLVPLAVARGSTVKALTVTPVERSPATAEAIEVRPLGIVASGLTRTIMREMGRTSTNGARVTSVRAGGAAQQARPPIEVDDVILEFDGRAVADAEVLRTLTEAALGSRERASVLISFERRDEQRLTMIELTQPRSEDPPLEARKAWLPVSLQVLTPQLAERLGLPGRTGVRITRVRDAELPLRVGDVVLAVDGQPVRASAPGDETVFVSAIRAHPVGSSVPLSVYRDGAEVPIVVQVSLAPRQPREMPRYDALDFGFRARDLAVEDTQEPRLKGLTQGVLVDAVEPGGWAALARLATGDIILSVDGESVASTATLAEKLKAAGTHRKPSVVFRVRRGVRTVFIEMEPSWPKQS